ncbi:MAG: OmpA family protein [Paracoccaceae bacterium]
MRVFEKTWCKWQVPFITAALLAFPAQTMAQDGTLAPGWVLNSEISALRFQSVKNETEVENSTFANYTGIIDETGLATIKIGLDSVDTKIDLRNVRMRFLFFETFEFPEAVITMQIAPEIIADLNDVRRKVVTLPYSISLHGVTSDREAELAIILRDDNTVSVTSNAPILLPVADFDLAKGIGKLEDAASVVIQPSASITFDFTFNRAASPEAFAAAQSDSDKESGASLAVLDTPGNFSVGACKGRYDILSQTDNIYFPSGSSRLETRSGPLLDSAVYIMNRCPDLVIEIAGHTDSDGGERFNQTLSEARANSVMNYLVKNGIDKERLQAVGFGEANPVRENDNLENKRRNRRIEFTVVGY